MSETAMLTADTERPGEPGGAPLWRDLPTHVWVKVLVLSALWWLLFRTDLGPLVDTWVNDNSWSHGFLIPLFSLYLLNQHKREILTLRTRPNYLGLVFLLACILVYVVNVISPSGYAYFRWLSTVGAIGSMVLLLGGWRLVRLTWLPVAFLLFAIPIPQRYYFAMTSPMRQWAAFVAGHILNVIPGIETSLRGVVIAVYQDGKFIPPELNVAEACSGMRLLMAFVALGVAMAYLHYRPLWQRLVLLASTVPIAIIGNVVRVTATGFIHTFIHPKYTQGVYHDMLGIAMLPLAFAMYGGLAWFMSGLFVEDTEIVPDIIVRKRDV